MERLTCLDAQATLFGMFDPSIAPALLYYAYLPIIATSLFLGTLALSSKNNFRLTGRSFFTLTIVYSLYLLNEINQWIVVPAGMADFNWRMIGLFFVLLAQTILYFVFVYIKRHDMSPKQKALLGLSLLPVILFLPTSINIKHFDVINCEGEIGLIHFWFIYPLILTVSVITSYIGINKFISSGRKDALFVGMGASVMLLVLLFADWISEHLGNFNINLIGPIGMLAFLAAITYAIVEFKAFNMRIIGVQVLVGVLWMLVGSLLLVVKSDLSRLVVSVTLFFTTVAGFFLIRSVKQEIQHREEIERLVAQLAQINARLRELDKLKSEFVSIASHQMRSPITAIRGYVSLLRDGSFGKITKKMEEPLDRIDESSKRMAVAIEDYLNISLIESGNMKYEKTDFNLGQETEKLCDDNRLVAGEKKLSLIYRSDLRSQGIIKADPNKTIQIIQNLLNNAIKYTTEGSIRVLVRDDIIRHKIFVEVEDTGIGMSEETLSNLFRKFERAHNEATLKVSGSGIGLFIAQKMAEGMGGQITAYSEGEGKGSRFTLEMALVG